LERGLVGDRKAPGQAVRRVRTRQLDQRQWIPARLGDDAVAHAFVERTEIHSRQQLKRIRVRQPLQPKLGQPGERARLLRVALGKQHEHALRLEPARDERQRLRRRMVEPLRVIHQADERLRLRDVREQRQDGKPDQERVDARH
jgi:hypothetical protein